MKKKIIAILMVSLIVLSLVACAGGKPKNMTQKTYDNGCRALEVMEKYNDMEITKEEAQERLESLQAALQSEGATLTNNLESTNNLLVETDVFLFLSALNGIGSTYDNEDALRERLGK